MAMFLALANQTQVAPLLLSRGSKTGAGHFPAVEMGTFQGRASRPGSLSDGVVGTSGMNENHFLLV